MANLRDVAKHAGVSVGTASIAFTGNRPISEATRRAVLDSAKQLGYKHRNSAAKQDESTTLNIGYVVPSLDNPFFMRLIEGVEEQLSQYSCNLVLINTSDGDYNRLIGISQELSRMNVHGIILTGSRRNWKIVSEACQKANLPAVILFSPHNVKDNGIDIISSDDIAGAFTAVSCLLESGLDRIAFVRVKNSHIHDYRLLGYKQALEKYGIPFDPRLVLETHGHDDLTVYAYAKAFLDRDNPFNGAFCCNDLMAFGLIRALKDKKLNVPQDVSVIGVDDTIGRLLTPSLTTIHIEAKAMGILAAEVLLEKIRNKHHVARSVVMPERLIIRDSTL